jgi:serine/threonine-protein kinase
MRGWPSVGSLPQEVRVGEGAGGGATAGRGEGPGALSRLLAELAEAPQADPGKAWANALRPGDVLDRFEILRELGRGGFGAVYEALDRDLGRKVALKTLRPGRTRDEWADEQLRREAKAAASLAHPGIVTLHEACTCDRGPYLVMELLRGETLEARLSGGPLPRGEAVEVGLQISRALAHVHGQGLVHRDLKPANVFLGDDGRVKLLDLGLAHLLGRKGATGGTPAYVAPEQWRGEEVDGKADVFALGAVLFEMASGRRAFEAKEERSTALDPGPAPALPGKVPRGLARLVTRCLAKEPAARPTAAQAAEELLAIQRGLARPRATRRIGLLVGAGVLAGIVIAAKMMAGRGAGEREGLDGRGDDEEAVPVAGAVPSIAVLPFADLSPGRDQEYFADGVAEEILNTLSSVEGLRVPGRSSSFYFKGRNVEPAEIARKLGVAHLLDGSVRRSGKRLRVTAEVVKASSGERLWRQTFERELTDVFAVQDEIASAVVEALKGRLLAGTAHSGPRPSVTTSPEAYSHYLLGQRLYRQFSPDSLRQAVDAFEKSVALDPRYGPAWAAMSIPTFYVGVYATSQEEALAWAERALAAAEKALALSPHLCDGLSARGYLRGAVRWDWTGGIADLAEAVRLCPGNPDSWRRYSVMLATLGRLAEAVPPAERAVQLDPLGYSNVNLSHILRAAGNSELSLAAAQRALDAMPDSNVACGVVADALLALGRPADSLERFRRCPGAWGYTRHGIVRALWSLGRTDEARSLLGKEEEQPSPKWVHIGIAHAWMGDSDKAFEWLNRAVDAHDLLLGDGFLARRELRPLQADPRWKALLRRMNLPVD